MSADEHPSLSAVANLEPTPGLNPQHQDVTRTSIERQTAAVRSELARLRGERDEMHDRIRQLSAELDTLEAAANLFRRRKPVEEAASRPVRRSRRRTEGGGES